MLNPTALRRIMNTVHQDNLKWWQDLETGEPLDRNMGEMLALVHSEVSEAYIGWFDGSMDSHLPGRSSLQVELADAVIRVLDILSHRGVDALYGWNAVEHSMMEVYKDMLDPGRSTQALLLGVHAMVSVALEAHRTREESLPGALVAVLVAVTILEQKLVGENLVVDLEPVVWEKLAYNRTRRDHTREARKEPGGKKY